MSSENQQSTVNLLCAKGCGFYGTPTTRNLCSKCYRDVIRQEQAQLHQSQQAPAMCQGSPADSTSAQHPHQDPQSNSSSSSSSDPSSHQSNHSSTEAPQHVSSSPPSPVGDAHVFSAPEERSQPSSPQYRMEGDERHSSSVPPTNEETSRIEPQPMLSLIANGTDASDKSRAGDPASSFSVESSQERPRQANRNRCWKCNKRVGLLGFQCRCGFFFCGSHRHADSHSCDFDYKSYERLQLSRANQKVVAEKVSKI